MYEASIPANERLCNVQGVAPRYIHKTLPGLNHSLAEPRPMRQYLKKQVQVRYPTRYLIPLREASKGGEQGWIHQDRQSREVHRVQV